MDGVRFNTINKISEFFEQSTDEVEFAKAESSQLYPIATPVAAKGSHLSYVYTTKPYLALAAKEKHRDFDSIGVAGRPGLPDTKDAEWLSGLVRNDVLFFLGDMDPVDLMVFAWLRAHLHECRFSYLGISDSYLRHFGATLPESFIIPCSQSEQGSLSFLKSILPDYKNLVGENCAALLDSGRKVEVEAIATHLGPPGPLLSPASTLGNHVS